MDDVIIARRDIEWAGPSIAVQACESLAQVDVLRALRLAEEACDGHVADEFLVSPAVMRVLHEAGELREPDGWMAASDGQVFGAAEPQSGKTLMEIDGIGGVVARPGAGRPRAWA